MQEASIQPSEDETTAGGVHSSCQHSHYFNHLYLATGSRKILKTEVQEETRSLTIPSQVSIDTVSS